MAEIQSIFMNDNDIEARISLKNDEYSALQNQRDVLVIPKSEELMNEELTIGTLGNSYRINLPKRLIKKNQIMTLPQKAKATVVKLDDSKYLVIRIEDLRKGIPKFKD